MNKKIVALLFTLVLALTALPVSASDENTGISLFYADACISGAEEDELDRVNWFFNENDGKYYMFLPSGVNPAALKIGFTADGAVMCGEKELENDAETDAFAELGEYTLTCSGKSYSVVFLADRDIAYIFITTESGSLAAVHADKEYKEKGNILIASGGETEYMGELKYIKGRGNSTWGKPKNPYNIKLGEKTDIFGMGKSNAWSLLANYIDDSSIRNRTAFYLADALGIEYTSHSRSVNLYVNGDYLGIYLLCEKVEVGSSRVDIEDLEEATEKVNGSELSEYSLGGYRSPDAGYTPSSQKWVNIPENPQDITGGYLLEYEFLNRYHQEVSGFVTDRYQPVILKSPEFASREQVKYISSVVQTMEDAVFSETGYNGEGEYYTDRLDLTSAAKVYLLNDFVMNLDAGSSSFYMYKDAGSDKLYLGPVWDYDYSLGEPYRLDGKNYADASLPWVRVHPTLSFPVDGKYPDGTVKTQGLLGRLFSHEDFREKVNEIRMEYAGVLSSLSQKVLQFAAECESSVIMNNLRWNTYKTTDTEKIDFLYNDSAVKTLTDFIAERISFIDREYSSSSFFVFYDANGGQGSTVDKKSYDGTQNAMATVSRFVPPDGKKSFEEWNTEPDGSGDSFIPGDSFVPEDDMTLYAIWSSALTEFSFPDPQGLNKGDLNGDGKVTASDARIALRIAAELLSAPENIIPLGDVNSNGKINAADARIILRVAAELETI